MGVHFRENEEKITTGMIIGGIVVIAILVASLVAYLINANNLSLQREMASRKETKTSEIGSDYATNGDEEFKTVSTDVGKTVNEAKNELKENENASNNASKENSTASSNSTSSSPSQNTSKNSDKKAEDTSKTENTAKSENDKSENEKSSSEKNTAKSASGNTDVKFSAPLKGEILREFAKDSLVYSNTLEEWITHMGVDIKADKTSVVKACQKGKVESIKNDPRYGLTVIVSHDNGYQTVYANLLTAEFVVEGEEIEEGQTIGTVGNSSSFEILDDYHLHFELIKDGENLNPCNFMEF